MKSTHEFPHKLLLPKLTHQWEATDWCTQQFGQRWSIMDNRQGVWCCFWRGFRNSDRAAAYEWYFQNEQDALMFLLRWS